MRQVVVLKNQYLQVHSNGLTLKITLILQNARRDESGNAIGDLSLGGAQITTRPAGDSPSRARTRLLAPGGSIAKEWQDFVGPIEIGLALREALGAPLYAEFEP